MKVIDASVAVKWFMEERGRDAAMEIIRSGDVLVAPDLVVFEVLNVLRRKHRLRSLSERQVVDAAEIMAASFSQFMPSATLAQTAIRLSMALDHSVYDCAYLACSVILDVPLVTADHVFAGKATKTSGYRVIILGDP